MAKKSWQRSSQPPFYQKSKYLAFNFKTWRKTKPKLSDQLVTIEQQLIQKQARQLHLQNQTIQKELTHQHNLISPNRKPITGNDTKMSGLSKETKHTTFFQQSILKRTRQKQYENKNWSLHQQQL